MRRFPTSWSTTLTQLGFRRKRNARHQHGERGRRPRFEPLEERRMLSVSPSDELLNSEVVVAGTMAAITEGTETQAQFVLLNEADLPSDQFVIRTEYDSGAPRAVISLREDLERVDDTLHTLELELRVGEVVLQHQTVLIDIESEEFRLAFLDERIGLARQELAEEDRLQIDAWREQLLSASEIEDDPLVLEPPIWETLENLGSAINSSNSTAETTTKTQIYTQIGQQAEDAKSQLLAAVDATSRAAAEEEVKQLGQTALLLANQISTDLASDDSALATAARALRDVIAGVVDRDYTLFAGLGIDHVVSNTVTEGGDREDFLAFVETGGIALNAYLRIDLGAHQAMVQATLQHGGMSAEFAGSALTEAIEIDTFVNEGDASLSHDSELLFVAANPFDTKHTLLRLDVANLVASNSVPTEAVLNLYATTGTPNATHTIAAHWDTWGASSNWDPSTLTWNDYITTLQTGFGDPINEWSVSHGNNSVDVTGAVQRALLFGDSNLSGALDHTNTLGTSLGDVEAFYTAVRYWELYVAENAPNEIVTDGLIYRNDANWDGEVDGDDRQKFFSRLGIAEGNFTLDSTVNGADYSAWSANYGKSVARFAQGDANFDGVVDYADHTIWDSTQGQANQTPAAPRLTLRVSTEDASSISYASTEHLSYSGPELELSYNAQIQVTQFYGSGEYLRVQYRVLHEAAQTPQITIYQVINGTRLTVATFTPQTAVGVYTQSITPSAIDDPTDEYSLVAEFTATNAATSERVYAGGAFQDAVDSWHIQGGRGLNTVQIDGGDLRLRGDFTITEHGELNEVTDIVYVHTADQSDVMELINVGGTYWFSGGGGNDQYIVRDSLPYDLNVTVQDSSGLDTLNLKAASNYWGGVNLDLSATGSQTVAANGGNVLSVGFVIPNAIDIVTEIPASVVTGRGYSLPILVGSLTDLYGAYVIDQFSLREALYLATQIPDVNDIAFDSELFANGPATITLTYDGTDGLSVPDQLVANGVTIQGPGADKLAISGGNQTRVMLAASSTIEGVTIRNGNSSDGGGIYASSTGTGLILRKTRVTGNTATGAGGGIYSSHNNLHVIDSEVSDNTAVGRGGGIFHWRYDTSKALTIVNSTISGNNVSSSNGSGGGLYAYTHTGSYGSGLDASITNSTISGNSAKDGGGIFVNQYNLGTLELPKVHNSIIAGNVDLADLADDVAGDGLDATSSYNLFGTGGSGGLTATLGNQVNVSNPGLSPLDFYDGPTRTHALKPTSPAIDAGLNANVPGSFVYDQRGEAFTRFYDDPSEPNVSGDATTTVDIGAFEYFGQFVWREAERTTAITHPPANVPKLEVVGDLTASGDRLLSVFGAGDHSVGSAPTTSTASIAQYDFDIAKSGDFRLWIRVVAPNANTNSLWWRANGGSWNQWDATTSGGWQWGNASAVLANLPAGANTLEIASGDDGIQIDKFLLTDNVDPFTLNGASPSNTGGQDSEVVDLQIVNLPATVRDFHAYNWNDPQPGSGSQPHPDFLQYSGTVAAQGLVESNLKLATPAKNPASPDGQQLTGAAEFRQWFEDASSVNQTANVTARLIQDSTRQDIFQFVGSFGAAGDPNRVATTHEFFPADAALFADNSVPDDYEPQTSDDDGPSGDLESDEISEPHNYGFTFETWAEFTYQTGQYIELLKSTDDLWIFIDGRLFVDLGGVHPAEGLLASLDSFGLTDGQKYSFDLFYANRSTDDSLLVWETNIDNLQPVTHLVEEDRLITQDDELSFVVPANPEAMRFTFYNLDFEGLADDAQDISDAFEIAVLMPDGRSALPTISPDSDAIFNISHGHTPLWASGVALLDGNTLVTDPGVGVTAGTVQIDISSLTPGTTIRIVPRLLNNDADNLSRVSIGNLDILDQGTFEIVAGSTSQLLAPAKNDSDRIPPGIKFAQLEDVTPSFDVSYLHTTADRANDSSDVDRIVTRLAVSKRAGAQQARGDLLLAITGVADQVSGLSDGTQLIEFDGRLPMSVAGLPAGTPYIRLSQLIASTNGFYDDLAETGPIELSFLHPGSATTPDGRFDFDLVLLGELNSPPDFTSDPYSEVRGGAYPVDYFPSASGPTLRALEIVAQNDNTLVYKPSAADPNGDRVDYVLISGPEVADDSTGQSPGPSMEIVDLDGDGFAETLQWKPTTAQAGLHRVQIRAIDEHGAFDPANDQVVYVRILETSANRPPHFETSPITLATFGETYSYDADAFDPDGHTLAYSASIGARPMQFEIPIGEILYATNEVPTDSLMRYLTFVNQPGATSGEGTFSNIRLFESDQLDDPQTLKFHQARFDAYGTDDGKAEVLGDGSVVRLTGDASKSYQLDVPYEITLNTVIQFTFASEAQGAAHGIGADWQVASQEDDRWFQVFGSGTDGVQGYDTYDPAWTTDLQIDSTKGEVTWNPPAEVIGEWVRMTITATETGAHDPHLQVVQSYDVHVAPGEKPPVKVGEVDLTVAEVDASGVTYDLQRLTAAGVIKAQVSNSGPGIVSGPYQVTFFEDVDFDKLYDPARDHLLATTVVEQPLPAGTTIDVAAPVAGMVQFAGAVIWAFVDSGEEIAENDETNNYAASNSNCKVEPITGFDPVVEWSKQSFSVLPDYDIVLTTPAVGDLNLDGTPDIVIQTGKYLDGQLVGDGPIRALNGATGAELWTIPPNGTVDTVYDESNFIEDSNGVALGDIDHDGYLEVIAFRASHEMVVFDHEGRVQTVAEFGIPGLPLKYPAIADLDNNGNAEIVFDGIVYDTAGTPLWWSSTTTGQVGESGVPVAVDLDGDGLQEVIFGKSAYDYEGNWLWSAAGLADQLFSEAAVGNLDDDDDPEIVMVSTSIFTGVRPILTILEHDGSQTFQFHVPESLNPLDYGGGPPVIADFDGDGSAEIGFVGTNNYFVADFYDKDDEPNTPDEWGVRWTHTIYDETSGKTGSAVFDFNGDGTAEIVYRDEQFLYYFRVPENLTEDLLVEAATPMPFNSITGREMPIVVDVDGDGNAEIVVPVDGLYYDAFGELQKNSVHGVFVIRDKFDGWVPTRQIWNQHSYHITNINDNGTIPIVEEPSWLSHNTYRLNTFLDPDFDPLSVPDLIPSYVRRETNGGETTYTVRVGNGGSFFAPKDVVVQFYNGNPTAGGQLIDTQTTLDNIDPGHFEDVSITVTAPPIGDEDLWVIVDPISMDQPFGMVRECDDNDPEILQLGNNIYQAKLGFVSIPPNHAPTIDSSPVRNVVEGEIYTYDVQASDEDEGQSDHLAYSLAVKPAGMEINPTTGVITWKPSPDQIAVRRHPVLVRVEDGHLGEDTQFFNVEIISDNVAPVITENLADGAIEDTAWFYDIVATDANSDPLTYSVTMLTPLEQGDNEPEMSTVPGQENRIVWTPSRVGEYAMQVDVSDGRGNDRMILLVQVTSDNKAPNFVFDPIPPVVLSEPWEYTVGAIDDQDSLEALHFTIDEAARALGITIVETGPDAGKLEWTSTAVTTASILVTVTDTDGAFRTARLTLPVNVRTSANETPHFDSNPEGAAKVGRTWTYQVKVTDIDVDDTIELSVANLVDDDGNPITQGFQLTTAGQPRGQGLITYTPPSGTTTKYIHFDVVAKDKVNGEYQHTVTQHIDLPVLQNSPPFILRAPGPGIVPKGVEQILEFDVIDFNGDALRLELATPAPGAGHFEVLNGPQWDEAATIASASTDPANPSRVRLLFTPEFEGEHDVTIRVIDSGGKKAEHTIHLKVEGAANDPGYTPPNATGNTAPRIVSTPPQPGPGGQVYSYLIRATDDDGHRLTMTMPNMPIDVDFDPYADGTAKFVWDSPAAGVPRSFTFVVTDEMGVSNSQTITLTPGSAGPQGAVDTPPIITNLPPKVVASGEVYRHAVYVTDPDASPTAAITYGLTAVKLNSQGAEIGPANFDGDHIDDDGVIEWPTDAEGADNGIIRVTITATQNNVSATQTYLLQVVSSDGNALPILDDDVPLSATPGQNFTFDVLGADPDDEPVEFFLIDGNGNYVREINGLSITRDGRVTWTVPSNTTVPSDRPFTVGLKDVIGLEAIPVDYTIDIVADRAPSVALIVNTLRPEPGALVVFSVVGTDDLGIAERHLQITPDGGAAIDLTVSADGTATYRIPSNATNNFKYTVTATVVDTASPTGQEASTSVELSVRHADPGKPVVSISGPTDGTIIETLTSLEGQIFDPSTSPAGGNLTYFAVIATPVGGGAPITLLLKDVADPDTYTNDDLVDPQAAIKYLKGIGTAEGAAEILKINPLALPSGTYRIEIVARDDAENESRTSTILGVTSDITLGNFALSFTDLSVSVAGVPITVSRRYDTVDAETLGDFGYGWSLDILSGKMDYLPAGEFDNDFNDFLGYSAPITGGSRVTFTLPNGETQSFRVVPVSVSQGAAWGVDGIQGQLEIFAMAFMPDPGQGSSLQFVDTPGASVFELEPFDYPSDFEPLLPELDYHEGFTSVRGRYPIADDDSEASGFISIGGDRTPMNFATIGANFILTTRDGTKYEYEPASGRLISVQDAYGNTIRLSDEEIVATDGGDKELGRLTIFRKDPTHSNLITSIEDAKGNAVEYEYDSNGNLIKFWDRVAVATPGADPTATYTYGEEDLSDPEVEVPDHILTTVTNALGIDSLRIGFDELGRLRRIQDASGPSGTGNFTYPAPTQDGRVIETAADANDITTEIVRDARGNVERSVQLVDNTGASAAWRYLVTKFVYDSHDRQTHVSVPFEVVGEDNRLTADLVSDPAELGFDAAQWQSRTTFDERGNLRSITDALGNTTLYDDYDTSGNARSITDPLGNVTSNVYVDGLLRSTIDATGGETEFQYNAGQLTGVTQIGGNGERLTTTFSYTNGRLSSTTGPDNQTRYFVYDQLGNQTLSYSHWSHGSVEKTIVTRTIYDENDRVKETKQFTIDGTANYATTEDFDNATSSIAADWSTSTQYNAAGQVRSTTDRFGSQTIQVYDVRGNVVETRTASKDQNGDAVWIVTRTLYDPNGRAYFTTDPYAVPQLGYLDTGASPPAYGTYTEFDDSGRVIRTARFSGVEVVLTDAGGDIRNSSTLFNFGSAPLSESKTYFDDKGQVRFTVDAAGLITKFDYDDAGRQQFVTQYLSGELNASATDVINIENTDTDVITTETRYDDAGRVERTFDAKNDIITKFEYDGVGRVIKMIADEGGLDVATTTHYDKLGRKDYELDAQGRRTDYEYDATGRLVAVILPGVDNPTGSGPARVRPRYEYEYDDYGNQVLVRDPMDDKFGVGALDKETAFTYDHFGRQTSRTLPDGLLETMTYSDAPLPALTTPANSVGLGQLEYTVDFEERVTAYRYDNTAEGGGRLVGKYFYASQQDYLDDAVDGALGAAAESVHYSYDAFGREVEVDQRTYLVPQLDFSTGIATYGGIQDGQSGLTPVGESQAGGTTFHLKYNAWKRVLLPESITISSATVLAFDFRLTTEGEIHAVGLENDDTYDNGQRLFQLAGGDTWSGAFQSANNIYAGNDWQAFEIALGQEASLVGLAVDRVAFANDHDASPRNAESYYRHVQLYDLRRTTTEYDAQGRVTQIASPEGFLNYSYDNLGRLERTWTSTDESGLTEITGTLYTYDRLGRLKTVDVVARNGQAVNEDATEYRYDQNGNLDLMERPNNVVTDYDYDELNRLEEQRDFTYVDANLNQTYDDGEAVDDLLASYIYTLRADGKRTQVLETDDQANETAIDWVYDELGRLTEERYNASGTANDFIAKYVYDLASNRVSLEKDTGNANPANFSIDEAISYLYDANDRLLIEQLDDDGDQVADRTTLYEYGPNADFSNLSDPEGGDWTAQTKKSVYDNATGTGTPSETHEYEYNVQGRLATAIVTKESDETFSEYVYNDGGVRVKQTVTVNVGTPVVTEYLIDPQNHTGYAKAIEEHVDGDLERTFTLGHQIVAQADSSSVYHFLHDGHGSTRALLNGSAVVVESYSYDAFGEAIGFNPATAIASWLFGGDGQYDGASELTNHIDRWRQGHIFVSMDRYSGNIQDPISLHKYLYANADPVQFVDPSGRFTVGQTLATIGIGMNLASFTFNFVTAHQAAQRGDTAEAAEHTVWAMLDLVFLALPGAGPGAQFARASIQGGGEVATIAVGAIQLSRAGVKASAIWGYLTSIAHVGDQIGGNFTFATSGGSGDGWVPETQSGWSEGARRYQAQITGRPGEAFRLNGFLFDGFDGTRLLDAKWRYSQFLKNGQQWQEWFNPEKWVQLAANQFRAAGGKPIRWVFAEKEVADAVRPLVERQGIEVVHVPANF